MKYGKVYFFLAFILVSFMAFSHFALANCGTCGSNPPCGGNCPADSSCPTCNVKTDCGTNCPTDSSCSSCTGETICDGAKMKEVTMTGKFFCSECMVSMTEMVVKGEEMPPMDEEAKMAMKQTAVDNMKNGAAILFMNEDGMIFTCTFCSECGLTREDGMDATMKDMVTVSGVLYCMGGQKLFKVQSIK